MRQMVLVLCVFVAGAATAMAQEQVKYDVGFGYVAQDLNSTSGGTGNYPRGYVLTLGWLLPNGAIIRLDGSYAQSHASGGIVNFGLGFESALEESRLRRLAVSVGYLFNRRGFVHPILHAGVARLALWDRTTGQFSGNSVVDVSGNDTVLNLGGGVEIGADNHNLLFDVTFDPKYKVPTTLGVDAEFDLTETHIAYVYRY